MRSESSVYVSAETGALMAVFDAGPHSHHRPFSEFCRSRGDKHDLDYSSPRLVSKPDLNYDASCYERERTMTLDNQPPVASRGCFRKSRLIKSHHSVQNTQ